jgi:membrane-associated phospholipid phosphatase
VSVDVRATLKEVARTPIHPDAIARVSARISGALALSVLGLTGLLLLRVDLLLKFDTFFMAGEPYRRWPTIAHICHYLDMVGLRGFSQLSIVFAFALYGVYKMRSWRPLIITVVGLLAINISVGALKYATARPSPRLGTAELLNQHVLGTVGLFPSGHAANVVIMWGIPVYIGAIALGWSARAIKRGAWVVVTALCVLSASSMFLQFHWPTDLLAGAMVGGAVLGATIAADRWRPGWYAPLDDATRVLFGQRRRYREDRYREDVDI